jgi:hypothetical protein
MTVLTIPLHIAAEPRSTDEKGWSFEALEIELAVPVNDEPLVAELPGGRRAPIWMEP